MPRWADMVLAVGALVFLAPVMVLLALAVALGGRGPVLFRQERVGRGGASFEILKFRTMVLHPEVPGGRLTVGAEDPRITRVGNLLRKFKLDELPQLWNVLKGEMRIVGPRPEVPEYVALWDGVQRATVLSVIPGITDPASIAFRDENEMLAGVEDPERYYVERILPEKLGMNARYLESRTAASDIGVIATTVRRAVMRA